MNDSAMRRPIAWIPVSMSVGALLLVLGRVATVGIVHDLDEGTPAHVFQLLMAAQVPFVAYFAVRWLPRARAPALRVLALQVGAALLAMASAHWLT